jgi:hypothetical protein
MRAHFALTLGAVLCAAWLAACGGDASDADAQTASSAEQVLGVGMRPPDGAGPQANALSSSDMPPDPSATVDPADLPPNS